MRKKKIFILLAHTCSNSFCAKFADIYEKSAKDSGHEVRRVNIGDLRFDSVLWQGYNAIQDLEPDLVNVQDNIRWCEHFVVLYPMWWSSMPAYFKGMIDRMWLPGFAFKFSPSGFFWEKLLKGRSARVIVTMDSPALPSRFMFGDSVNEIKRGVLGFSGFSPVRVKKFGLVKKVPLWWKKMRERKVARWGRKGI
jgi:NAD(P)H dehydrogenase (quinone)